MRFIAWNYVDKRFFTVLAEGYCEAQGKAERIELASKVLGEFTEVTDRMKTYLLFEGV